MTSESSINSKTQQMTGIDGNEKTLDQEMILNPKNMEKKDIPDNVNGKELISKSSQLSEIRSLDETIETETRRTTINDLPHDIIMIIFDNLNICMIACLGLTCPQFYASCKIYYPRPFNLALNAGENHQYFPLKRSDVYFDGTFGGYERSKAIYLADLIESWKGLRYHRKTRLYIQSGSYMFMIKYLSIYTYNPSNERCKARLALQNRYRDFYRTGGFVDPWMEYHGILPNPHQMTPHAWFLKAKEYILEDRSAYKLDSHWVFCWGMYLIAKNCGDWLEQMPFEYFSDWREMMSL